MMTITVCRFEISRPLKSDTAKRTSGRTDKNIFRMALDFIIELQPSFYVYETSRFSFHSVYNNGKRLYKRKTNKSGKCHDAKR
jgi:hypothetical protein